mmetsp:Transcript_73551/g.221049  ORF Transcript_73551/g.221049 Transcript_73551/m.221049 type:complete len:102 (-) Transcript_73551:221-526(-)
MDMDMDNHGCASSYVRHNGPPAVCGRSRVVVGKAMRHSYSSYSSYSNYNGYSSYSRATAKLQQLYSRATVTPPTTPPHTELQSQLQSSYAAQLQCATAATV